MDFNQVSARGLKRMMRNVIRRSADKEHVDVVHRFLQNPRVHKP